MKPYVYAIGDIHGEEKIFRQLLSDFDQEMHQLVLMGDLLDRGFKSKQCLLLGKELAEKYHAVYLMGNHEDLFLSFLKDPEGYFFNYLLNGGRYTIDSLLHEGATKEYSATEISMMIRSRYKDLVKFLKKLPLYYEWHDYVFVHAGVNLALKNWRHTSNRDFVWIREPFHTGKNNTGKTIVFGHTPVQNLFVDNTVTKLWQQDKKIGMDGGGVYGGSIHGVIFSDKGIVQDIEIQNNEGGWRPDF